MLVSSFEKENTIIRFGINHSEVSAALVLIGNIRAYRDKHIGLVNIWQNKHKPQTN